MSKLRVYTNEKKFPIAPDLYGVFFEDISHAGDGGLYPEMIRNRSFEDSLIPERCKSEDCGKTFVSPTGWIDEFNNGEGMEAWTKRPDFEKTEIPAWYVNNASFKINTDDTLNAKRKASMIVDFKKGGSVYNVGYCGVPQEEGKKYKLYFFAKADKPINLEISIEDILSNNQSENAIEASYEYQNKAEDYDDSRELVSNKVECTISDNEWTRYDFEFTAIKTTKNARIIFTAKEEGIVSFGFTSLMPADTFNNHGLRKDLVEKLRDIKPSFLRFPGGCIVEGFTIETAMYFRNTIGPVWERPSHWLLWHYRTTNGLGFHEYMQLCEDLSLTALYVCNCGMTCQGRGPYYFNDEEFNDMLQDTLNALEYAKGSSDTKWGSVRAKMGHAEPFDLKYLEIGNENSGKEYNERYEIIKNAVKEKYPDIIFITNDRDKSIEADIIDDHYYNMPEFYAENLGCYDDYDRTNPDIFVGEFAVNQTFEGQLRAAISEAMFMIGFERNQDVVKLASYAPLFEHINYYSWYPNLIIFDNMHSYGIPSYYVWKLFGNARGKNVVKSEEEVGKIYRDLHGLPMVTGDFGVRYRNPRFESKAIEATRNLFGMKENEEDGFVIVPDPENEFTKRPLPFRVPASIAFGVDELIKTGTFEVEAFAIEGKEFGIGMLAAPKPLSFYDRMNPNPRDPWGLWNMEPLRFLVKDNQAALYRGGLHPEKISDSVEVKVKYNEYNKLRYELNNTHVELFLNDEFIQRVELPNYQSACSVVTDSENEIIIKYVNFDYDCDAVEISLDCDVEEEYELSYLTGKDDDENSIENPTMVSDKCEKRNGAGRQFVFKANPLSVNVIKLKKKR